ARDDGGSRSLTLRVRDDTILDLVYSSPCLLLVLILRRNRPSRRTRCRFQLDLRQVGALQLLVERWKVMRLDGLPGLHQRWQLFFQFAEGSGPLCGGSNIGFLECVEQGEIPRSEHSQSQRFRSWAGPALGSAGYRLYLLVNLVDRRGQRPFAELLAYLLELFAGGVGLFHRRRQSLQM